MSILYIVATPIGNLKDITLRALDVLREVDFVLAEDTRKTRKLLDAYEIKTPLLQHHQHSKNTDNIIDLLEQGKDLGLVSDAGTPGVNDPGGKLIAQILESQIDVEITPIPGASALTAIISVAGIPMEEFTYKGFVPHKKGRQTYLKQVLESPHPVVFFESTHRIIKTMEQLADLSPTKKCIIGRELTKLHETIYRGTILDVLEQIKETSTKGEFVIIVH